MISKKNILVNAQIDIGSQLDATSLSRAKTNILNSVLKRFVSDIEFTTKGSKLIIHIKEKFCVTDIVVHNAPGDQQQTFCTQNIILFNKGDFISEQDVAVSAWRINKVLFHHKITGALFSDTTYKIDFLSDNTAKINFYINVGPKNYVQQVHLVGNYSFSDNEIKNILLIQPKHQLLMMFYRSCCFSYDPAIVNQDIEILKNFYKDKGFLDVKILPPYVVANNNFTNTNVTYSIVEGNQYKINQVQVRDISNSLNSDIINKIRAKYLDLQKIDFVSIKRIKSQIAGYLLKNGIKSIDVVLSFEDGDNYTKNVTIELKPLKRITINKIHIIGNNQTKENLIRGRLTIKEGMSYNPLDKDISIKRVQGTGLFKDVNISVHEISDYLVDIQVKVKETSTFQSTILNITNAPSIGSSVSDKNVFGSGLKVTGAFNIYWKQLFESSSGVLTQEKHKETRSNAAHLLVYHPYLFNYDALVRPFIKLKYSSDSKSISRKIINDVLITNPHLSFSSTQKDDTDKKSNPKKGGDLDKVYSGLHSHTVGLGFGTDFVMHEDWNLRLGFGLKKKILSAKKEYESTQDSILNIADASGMPYKRLRSKISLIGSYKTVDSTSYPKRGISSVTKLVLMDYANEFNRLKLSTQSCFYHSFYKNLFTLAYRINAGVLLGKNVHLLSYDDKFHNKIPGFERDGTDPWMYIQDRDENILRESLGSDFFWNAQVELRFPLGPQILNLSAFIFSAIGDSFDIQQASSDKNAVYKKLASTNKSERAGVKHNFHSQIRFSSGIGLRYEMPVVKSVIKIFFTPEALVFGDSYDQKHSFEILLNTEF